MRAFGFINLSILGLILITITLFTLFKEPKSSLGFINRPSQKELPKSPFSELDEFFQELGENVFNLKWVAPQMQLPDLRQELIFFGKNLRPDAATPQQSFYLGLKGKEEQILVHENEKIYLVYQGSYSKDLKRPPQEKTASQISPISQKTIWGEIGSQSTEISLKNSYNFSQGNQATPLWFELKSVGDSIAEIHVSMEDAKGLLIETPQEFSLFHCQAHELPKSQGSWELGGYRVDTTLLIRQKARWVGPDLFLELHGGDEFHYAAGKERVDFLETENPYSCFISMGDFLIWKENRWKVVDEGETTQQLPLMIVKKMDEKLISFELWDPEGKNKTFLSLIRCRESNGKPNLTQELKFVGAKTWAQFIVECRNGSRMTLKPHDWLVFTQDGWKKLESSEEIDAYVNQSLTGPLFILDKMSKQNGKQVLMGHLFNTSRTEVEQVELSAASGTSLANFYRHIPMAPPPIHLKHPEIYSEGVEE